MKPTRQKPTLLAVLGLSLACAQIAHAGQPLPPMHKAGATEYLSGGIGKDESQAIKKAGAHWPLMLEFGQKDQHKVAFTADVDVNVRDADGHTVLATRSEGPLMLARLKPGHYTVQATMAGQALSHEVTIKAGHPAHARFVWPENKHAS